MKLNQLPVILDREKVSIPCPFVIDKGNLKSRPKAIGRIKEIVKCSLLKYLSGRPRMHKPRIPAAPRCVIIATGSNLGGSIISLPLIGGVKERWPNAELVIVSNRQHGIDIVKRSGLGNHYYVVPEVSIAKVVVGCKEVKAFRKILLKHNPDLFIGNFDFRLGYVLPMRKISCIITQQLANSFHPESCQADYKVQYDWRSENWLEGYWKLMKQIGVITEEFPFISSDGEKGKALITKKLGIYLPNRVRVIGVQSSVWEKQLFKAWPTRKMVALCLRLIQLEDTVILVIGSNGQDSLLKLLQKNNKWPGRVLDGVGKFSIEDLPDVVKACSAVVSNDSGLMHLAAATETPTIALYGMTDPFVTWVYGFNQRNTIIRKASCEPCYHQVREVIEYCQNQQCIKDISVEIVYRAVLNQLQRSLQQTNE